MEEKKYYLLFHKCKHLKFCVSEKFQKFIGMTIARSAFVNRADNWGYKTTRTDYEIKRFKKSKFHASQMPEHCISASFFNN